MAQDTPPSLRSSSIYQVHIRNYSRAGTFEAALPSLDAAVRLGFDIVYLMPLHPVGTVARKGSLGSPYAIADYRTVDPEQGGEAGFARFLEAAHRKGLRVIMDVVFNHTSPDSLLARTHPDWFHKGKDGRPAPRVEEWSDVVDLDHSHRGLRDYLIATLAGWVRFGVDGFRCDVASLVPLDFWMEARKACALAGSEASARAGAAARSPGSRVLWLAETAHKEFVDRLRSAGVPAWSDGELHEAFDLSYDYDGRQDLEEAWAGRKPLSNYLNHLLIQRSMLPAHAIKARFLENHDQERAASRFGRAEALRNWTAFAMLLEGCFFAYAGQERALERRPSIFEADPLDWEAGDPAFEAWFSAAHRATRAIRAREDRFAIRELVPGLVLVERSGGGSPVAALLNLEGRNGTVELPLALKGNELLTGAPIHLEGRIAIPREPLIVEMARVP